MKASEASAVAARARVRAAGATDPGRVRTGNEDRLHLDVERGIFAVVDGVGGHAAGEVAAAIAIDVIVQRLERPLWSPEQRVREAIALANNEILTEAHATPARSGMTCVLTLALLTDHGVTVGHVGDTRLYKLSPTGIVKLTHDHSPVGMQEDAREISEMEAMRHPRRNEVFRDVGSAFHQPDDPDFVEVLEAPFDERSALLLCSDGLSDMLPSSSIARIVREHAGDPAAVVDALIGAANEAGGKDNVTAVYVEGQQFAHACAQASRADSSSAAAAAAPEPVPAAAGGFWQSRLTWCCIGALAGLAGGLALAWSLSLDAPLPRRPLVVGSGADHIASIGEAMNSAMPGDVVLVEPGEYAESVVLADGVDLEARIPGTVTLIAPSDRQEWVGLRAAGRYGNRIRGIRVLGTPEAPIAAGLQLTGHGVQATDLTIEGAVAIGIDIETDGAVMVGASRFVDVTGTPLRVGGSARPIIRENLFLHRGDRAPSAIDVAAGGAPVLERNMFAGFVKAIHPGPDPGADPVPEGNVWFPHAFAAGAGSDR